MFCVLLGSTIMVMGHCLKKKDNDKNQLKHITLTLLWNVFKGTFYESIEN